MEKHTAEVTVKVYAVYFWLSALAYLVAGLALVFGGSLLTTLSGGMMGLGELEMGMLGGAFAALGMIFGIVLLVFAAFAAWVGVGLWQRSSWARITAIVLSVLALFSFPLGTIVGALGIAFFGFNDDVIALFGKGSGKKR